MLKARIKNRVVRIPDYKKQEYIKLGYTITEEDGTVVYKPENKDETIAELRAEIERLKGLLEQTQAEQSAKQAKKKGSKPAKAEE